MVEPRHFGVSHDATELSRPEATTILGAAKIVGRTQGGTSFVFLYIINRITLKS